MKMFFLWNILEYYYKRTELLAGVLNWENLILTSWPDLTCDKVEIKTIIGVSHFNYNTIKLES